MYEGLSIDGPVAAAAMNLAIQSNLQRRSPKREAGVIESRDQIEAKDIHEICVMTMRILREYQHVAAQEPLHPPFEHFDMD